ncbi:hypothetical protein ULVI_04530 [Cochleicola gelatinilyticus]|uniref:Transglutaminase-like domain-containing protein n=2 Tax=Cochleicola gelatinilyticus TaxID=1763537 RepID=A0A167ITU4_9FLAO|nr:hypothetical protein ULVI_04530 [Cochleicola gelatinilyticus]
MRLLSISMLSIFITISSTAQIGAVIGGNTIEHPNKVIEEKNKKLSVTKNLAEFITKYCNTDREKAFALYNWLAQNIAYDHELRTNRKMQKEVYVSETSVVQRALSKRKALCGGYAFLFRDLCKELGIQTKVIHGFSKSYTVNKNNLATPNHTWNAVLINGNWHLLDITMARSQGSGGKPSSYWFMTDPTYFIKTHFPENRKWSFLKHPISRSEFEKLPSI